MEEAAFRDALDDYISLLGDSLAELEISLSDAALESDWLYDDYVEHIGELVCDFADEPMKLEHYLATEKEKYNLALESRGNFVQQTLVEIGF